jgi:hypothetical protein
MFATRMQLMSIWWDGLETSQVSLVGIGFTIRAGTLPAYLPKIGAQ